MNKPLRIVFMGTPGFASGVLTSLKTAGYHLVGIVSVPDKPSGRGLLMHSSEVTRYAREQSLPLSQPASLKDPAFIAQLREWDADLFVVVAFRMLPGEVWKLPRLGTFNLHASLLPQYRGAAPINWALIRGEKETGVTTFLIDHQIDTGNILFQEPLSIAPEETAGSLHDRLMVLGSALVCRTIDAFAAGGIHPVPQPQVSPLYAAPKLNKELCRISWEQDAQHICNLIRGLSPYPAAFGLLQTTHRQNGQEPIPLKIFTAKAVVREHSYPCGAIFSDHKSYIHVACRGGYVSLLEIQAAGKKRMPVNDFLLGFRNITEAVFVS